MPSLKEYRNRIASVKSTRKITSAMKMVAASKLRRAQIKTEESKPYANRLSSLLVRLVDEMDKEERNLPLISGHGEEKVHLFIVLTSDNGLCGGFNNYVLKLARQQIKKALHKGQECKIISVGRKGSDVFRREFKDKLIASYNDFGRRNLIFNDAHEISNKVLHMFNAREFDICTIVYNRFDSVISQVPVFNRLIPFYKESAVPVSEVEHKDYLKSTYIFEPDERQMVEKLLPLNLSLQIYRAILDNSAGEKAARMTAMDNATNNADDMIATLTLNYNRARQAYITKELIEIISGAEAV